MTDIPPTLLEWHGLKPPEIRMIGTSERSISKDQYSQVYWIVQVRLQDNVIIEAYPLKSWRFAADSRLIGEVDTGAWKQVIEISPDEYVVLSVK
ncbi:MAG: hypothetical protein ABI970_20110 [Chloroflexota bacterium]